MDLSFSISGKRIEAAWHGPRPEQAPTLVLLHEGLGSVAMWKEFRDNNAEIITKIGFGIAIVNTDISTSPSLSLAPPSP